MPVEDTTSVSNANPTAVFDVTLGGSTCTVKVSPNARFITMSHEPPGLTIAVGGATFVSVGGQPTDTPAGTADTVIVEPPATDAPPTAPTVGTG